MEESPGVQDASRNKHRMYKWKQYFTTTLGRGNIVVILLCLGAMTAFWLGGPVAGNFANIIALSGLIALLLVANFLTFGWCKKFATSKDEKTGAQKTHWLSFFLFVGITALVWADLVVIIRASIEAILQMEGG